MRKPHLNANHMKCVMGKKKSSDIKNVLALIAGVLCIVEGVLRIIGSPLLNVGGLLSSIVGGILAILLGVIILMSSGYITDKLNIPFNTVTSLIFYILCFIFGSFLGFILLLIAFILFLVNK